MTKNENEVPDEQDTPDEVEVASPEVVDASEDTGDEGTDEVIDVSDGTTVDDSTEDSDVSTTVEKNETVEPKGETPSQLRKSIILRSVAVFLAFIAVGALAIGGERLLGDSSGEPTSSASPSPSASESEAPSDTDVQTLAEGLTVDTSSVVAQDLFEQYGEDSAEYIQFGMGESDVNREGEPAAVSLATYSNVPADFNYDQMLDFFANSTSQLPGGNWQASEAVPSGSTIVNVRTLRITGEHEGYPAEVEIAVFRQSADADVLTVTVTSSLLLPAEGE